MNQLPSQPGGNEPDVKAIWAIFGCILFFLIYQAYMAKKYPQRHQPQQPVATQTDPGTTGSDTTASDTTTSADGSSSSAAATTTRDDGVQDVDPETLVVDTKDVIYSMSQAGGFRSIVLKDYKDKAGKEGQPIDLLDSPLIAVGATQVTPGVNDRYRFNAARDGRTITLWRNSGAFKISQTYTFPEEGFTADIRVVFENIGENSAELNAVYRWQEDIRYSKTGGFLPGMPMERPSLVYSVSGKSDMEDLEGYCDDPEGPAAAGTNTSIDYIGYDKHYFLLALLPQTDALTYTMQRLKASEASCTTYIAISQPHGLVKPGEQVALDFQGYFGPKQIELLEKVDPTLPETIDFGFFAVIAKPLQLALQGIYGYIGNYGVAIILLTILLKIIFYPLVKASASSMHKMKKLNPEMQAMREKYKDDPMRQREEMMKFWQKHQINPMKGCFPILPQIPVFFAFYQTLFRSIELRHAPLGGWIQDLSIADPYYVTPILMAAAMFVQQKLTPTTGMDKTQEKIMLLMPVMFAGFMLTLPAGLTLYMLVNSLISIGQQQWLYRKLDKLES